MSDGQLQLTGTGIPLVADEKAAIVGTRSGGIDPLHPVGDEQDILPVGKADEQGIALLDGKDTRSPFADGDHLIGFSFPVNKFAGRGQGPEVSIHFLPYGDGVAGIEQQSPEIFILQSVLVDDPGGECHPADRARGKQEKNEYKINPDWTGHGGGPFKNNASCFHGLMF
jgi:hypothetical protein